MGGTRAGGLEAAKTNKVIYGEDFYTVIGRAGGLKSRGGGFAKNPELARIAGAKGGAAGRRTDMIKGVHNRKHPNCKICKELRDAQRSTFSL